jgi:lipopolysaccharide/colanic/teichoic acid biosynthesis glycosyltransferase
VTPGPTGPGPRGPSGWLRLRTSCIDRLAALVLLPVLGPVAAVLAWRVRHHDGPPSMIGLDRVGRHGVPFRMWKLRSMRVEQPGGAAGGAVITSVDDDRVTPLGHRLRRWRLDELPNLVNVLRGDMGLVGPRPETPSLVDGDDPAWQAVLALRPGITGATQLVVERWESEVLEAGSQEQRYRDEILPVKLAVDRWYVERATPVTDLCIAWSMLERFVLGRAETAVERQVRREVPEAGRVPLAGDGTGDGTGRREGAGPGSS